MTDLEKLYPLIGLANRARKLTLGMSATLQAIRQRRVQLLILADNISVNAASKVEKAAIENGIAIVRGGSKDAYGQICGRAELGIIGVEDTAFAKSLRKVLE